MAPVDLDTAYGMVAEVQTLQMIHGPRGRPLGDLDALAWAICALSAEDLERDAMHTVPGVPRW